ncbi:MotA/TolQ/ExbB proton channel family protein [Roseimicrobium sp. ORNL1]|uniref:MotA/TolQ/ExbB proton channel family protein n=1 Tax=Roseimicrobium sp. ORNL1 TaxID=2711231 RepID=UPI0013E0EBAE|nr:MotA/TolQ/ExbB proton channel family protein [Roseimicrobium sp. ORNL1]QIF00580.1 MotA/TolQ/ExbB proton channel family protein [Roseimicrobium sp. ORNL1]
MRSFLLIVTAAWLVFGAAATIPAQTAPAGGGSVSNQPTISAAPAQSAPQGHSHADANGISEVKRKMGLLFYPMVVLSLVTLMLIFFNLFTIRQNAVVSDAFMNSADALIRKQDYLGLLAVCNRRNECVAKVTAKALDFATKNPTASFDEVREVTEAEGSRQASLILQRISYLGDVGSISPMMGLLGTVFGLITSFNQISSTQFAGGQAAGVATGVYEALYCTAAGLIIGIPALIIYAFMRGKAQRLVSELESASTHLMALLAAQYKRAARAVASRMPAASHGEAM